MCAYQYKITFLHEQEPHSNDELHASPCSSPSVSSTMQKVVDLEIAVDKRERQSPVSVLEPLFMEDDISPARTASRSGRPGHLVKIKSMYVMECS